METCENGKKLPERSRSVLGRFYCIYITSITKMHGTMNIKYIFTLFIGECRNTYAHSVLFPR